VKGFFGIDMTIGKTFRLSAVFVVWGSALAFEFARGAVSPRELGAGFLLLVGSLFAVIVHRQKVKHAAQGEAWLRLEETSAKEVNALRRPRVLLVVSPALLVLGLWLTGGGFLFPRLVGICINLGITLWIVVLLRRAKGSTR
jgi:hypothetical protein